jgi:hypothetical protein
MKGADTMKKYANTQKSNYLELPESPKNPRYQWKDQEIKVEVEQVSEMMVNKESKVNESLCLSMQSVHGDTMMPLVRIGMGSSYYSVLREDSR